MIRGASAATLRLAGMGGRFVLLFVIGRLMSPEDLGLFGLFAVTCVILTQVVGLELHQPAIREFVRRAGPAREALVRAQLLTYGFTYLLLPAVLLIACGSGALSLPHALLLTGVVVGGHLSLEANRLLIACGRADHAYFVLALAHGLWVYPLAVVMTLVPESRTLSVVFGSWCVGSLLAAFAGFSNLRALGLLTSGGGQRPDTAFLRAAWPSALTFMASTTAFLLVESVDRYMIEHFLGTSAVGVYTLYAGVARVLREIAFAAIIATSMPLMIASGMSTRRTSLDLEQRRILRRLVFYIAAAAPTLAIGFVLALPILGNATYEVDLEAYYLLLASSAIGTLAFVPHYALYSLGREKQLLAIHVTTLAVAVIANVALVPSHGIIGAAVASVVSASFMAGAKWWSARRALAAIPQSE